MTVSSTVETFSPCPSTWVLSVTVTEVTLFLVLTAAEAGERNGEDTDILAPSGPCTPAACIALTRANNPVPPPPLPFLSESDPRLPRMRLRKFVLRMAVIARFHFLLAVKAFRRSVFSFLPLSFLIENQWWDRHWSTVARLLAFNTRRLLMKSLASSEISSNTGSSKSQSANWTLVKVSASESPINGDKPLSRIYAMTPIDQTSVAGPIRSYLMTSGATNSGVPNITLRFSFGLYFLARPKSMSLICLLSGRINMIFSGLRSRCRTSCWCMCWMPSNICFM